MARPVTVRLEEATRRRLASMARRRGRTPSVLVRTAIEAWLESQEGASGGRTPYETVADLVGSVRGGDRRRSTRGARAVAETLRKRSSARR